MKNILIFVLIAISYNSLSAQRSLVSSEEITYIEGAKIHITCDLYEDGSFEGRVSINHSGCPKVRVRWKFYNLDSEYLANVADHIVEGDYATCNQSRNFFKKGKISETLAKKINSITIQVIDRNW